MLIDRDTKIYGSFSLNPGMNGSVFFNTEFNSRKVNAIYRPFKVDNLKEAIEGAIAMKFSGLGISMPYKTEIIKYCTQITKEVESIGACNTVIIKGEEVIGYNTDWIGIKEFFKLKNIQGLSIIGTGGFSKAIQYYCKVSNLPFEIFTRINIDKLQYAKYPSINATPADFLCDYDGRPFTVHGKSIALLQAQAQLKLYLDNE